MRFVSRPETNLTDRVVDNKKCSIVVLGFQKYIYFQKIESIYIWFCVCVCVQRLLQSLRGGFHPGIVVLEAVYAS